MQVVMFVHITIDTLIFFYLPCPLIPGPLKKWWWPHPLGPLSQRGRYGLRPSSTLLQQCLEVAPLRLMSLRCILRLISLSPLLGGVPLDISPISSLNQPSIKKTNQLTGGYQGTEFLLDNFLRPLDDAVDYLFHRRDIMDNADNLPAVCHASFKVTFKVESVGVLSTGDG